MKCYNWKINQIWYEITSLWNLSAILLMKFTEDNSSKKLIWKQQERDKIFVSALKRVFLSKHILIFVLGDWQNTPFLS